MSLSVTPEDVAAASQRLYGIAHHTPVLTFHSLNLACGREVFLKCENLQRVGAFKFRGAYNAVSQLDETAQKRGVITHSSGDPVGIGPGRQTPKYTSRYRHAR